MVSRLTSAPDIEAMVMEEDSEGKNDIWETNPWSFSFRIVLFSQSLSVVRK